MTDLPSLSARGAERVGVRWGTFQLLLNGRQNPLDVVEDVIVPKPDDAIAVIREFSRA
jgi:hypothetical protein